ncbi:MAG: adenylate kinase family protein [Thermoplasmata archaeon]
MTTALTGTPGVGKTTAADELRNEGYRVLDLNKFIHENGLRGNRDEDRDTYEVDIERLKLIYEKDAPPHDIVEGHLSHRLDISRIIVLRCRPDKLKERMASKDWPEKKKRENLEAETMDVILIESLQQGEHIYEIDTTNKEPEEVKESIIEILEGNTEKYLPGGVDWTKYIDS